MDDPDTLTTDNVALVVTGWIYVAWPPGSYPVQPDEMFLLDDVLAHALAACGMADKLDAVATACRRHVIGRFQTEVDRLEKERQRIVEGGGE